MSNYEGLQEWVVPDERVTGQRPSVFKRGIVLVGYPSHFLGFYAAKLDAPLKTAFRKIEPRLYTRLEKEAARIAQAVRRSRPVWKSGVFGQPLPYSRTSHKNLSRPLRTKGAKPMKEPLVGCGIRCSVCLELLSVGQVNEETRGVCEPVIRTELICPRFLSINSLADPSHGRGKAAVTSRAINR